jgi:hypothetical protein
MVGLFYRQPVQGLGGDQPLPDECQILFGLHSSLESPVPAIVDDRERSIRLGAMFKNHLRIDKRPVKLVKKDPPYYFDASLPFSDDDPKNIEQIFLHSTYLRGDLVWDEQQELEDAQFLPGVEAISDLSTVIRQRNFQRHFSKILPPAGLPDTSVTGFYESVVTNATYDSKGNYYPKYKDPSPEKPQQRVFEMERLSDPYIKQNFFEIFPAVNVPHVMFRAGKYLIIYELRFDESGVINAKVILVGGVLPGENIWDYLTHKNPTGKPMEAIFFLSNTGPKIYIPPKIINYVGKVPLGHNERVVNPRNWVLKQWEVQPNEKGLPDNEWDWFVAMVDMRFGDRVYEVHVSKTELAGLDREKLIFEPLDNALKESTGEFKKVLKKALRKAKRKPTINFFLQGLPLERTGNRRYIGSEHGFTYIRRIKDGLTTRIRDNLFMLDLKIVMVSDLVYKKTKHLIPVIMVFTFLATALLLPIVGAVSLWGGFVWLVKDQVMNFTNKKFVREGLKRFKTQLQFLMVDMLVSLFPQTNMKYLEFVRGFLRGFARDALESLLKKYKDFIIDGPMLFRWYKLFSRLRGSLDKVQDKVDELKGVINPAAGKLLIKRFEDIGHQARSSAVLLFSNVYFLDYDSAEEVIEIFSDLADQPPITREKWEKARTERMRILLDAYSQTVSKASKATDVKFSGMKTAIKDISVREEFKIISKLSDHFAIVCMVALVGGTIGLTAMGLGKLGFRTIWRILSYGPKAILQGNYTAKELRILGQLLGHVVGAFFLNGAIFAKGTRLGRLANPEKKKDKGKLKKVRDFAVSKVVGLEFGHGIFMPIAKLAASHYLILFQRIKGESEDLWKKIEQDILKQLYGKSDFRIFLDQGKQPISFEKAKVILSMLDTILVEYLDELLKTPDMDKKLASAAKYLETAKAPSWDDLLEGRTQDKFSREAMSFAAISHLHSVLDELGEMLRYIMDPVRTAKGHEVSLHDILNILGLTTSEDQAQEALSKRLIPVFGNEIQQKEMEKKEASK